MKTIEERLDRIEQILKDNKQHELHCPALTTVEDAAGLGGMFFSMSAKLCDCWISEANPSDDPTKGFGIYEKATQDLRQTIYPSRYAAVQQLIDYRGLSRDPEAEHYYGKDFLIVEVTAQPAPVDKSPNPE